MTSEFDVAVIGGGLAGCCAAIHLARHGWKVVLLEARTYPHHKVCGEFLSPECAILLDDLDVMPALNACQPVAINIAEITAPSGASWTSRFPAPAIGISRAALDAILADQCRACGITVIEGAAVRGVQGNLESGFSLSFNNQTLTARAVIGAHGKRAGLDRALGRSFLQKPQPFVGLKNHFHGAPLPDRVELHAFSGGYCGMSEVEGGLTNVCLLVRQDVFQKAANGDVPAFITWMQGQNPRLKRWLSDCEPVHSEWLSIAQVPFVDKHPVEADILMAGDSAGLIAPVAGSGMGMALQGGKLAAEHLNRFLGEQQNAAALRSSYAMAWRRQFDSRLRLGRFLQTFMLKPSLLSTGLRLMNTIPPLGTYFLNHTRDYQLTGNRP
jgi:menaquinone-9 beta-reductase